MDNSRIKERTTLDGDFIIAGISFIFKPIASLVAYGAIAYGAWTIWKRKTNGPRKLAKMPGDYSPS